jgi:hypothetical protein
LSLLSDVCDRVVENCRQKNHRACKAGEHNPEAIQEEVRNAERVQLEAIDAKRSGMASQSPTRKKEPLRPAVCVR